MPIFKEGVEVIASDLKNTTWTELWELWQKAYLQQLPPEMMAEISDLVQISANLHARIVQLSAHFPNELY